jgi:hypothetical protein
MDIDLTADDRKVILLALAEWRRKLGGELAQADHVPIEGLDMGMSFLGSFDAIAEKLGGNPEAENFGAAEIRPD